MTEKRCPIHDCWSEYECHDCWYERTEEED